MRKMTRLLLLAAGLAALMVPGSAPNLAQTAAALVVHTLGPTAEGKLVYFMSVEQARFRKPVVPGDLLRVKVVCQHHRGRVWKFDGEAMVGDNRMAEATFTAMVVDH